MSDVVALVSCSFSKGPKACPAQDLFISPLFLKMRQYAQANSKRWFILSALHGLVDPTTEIEPYKKTLNSASRDEQREWARRVYFQLQGKGLVNTGQRLMWLAGPKYLVDLQPMLPACKHRDPLKEMGTDERLIWLTKQCPDP
ncbi:MAG: hypothetical protein ACI89L_002617 [Phycisphaerales bacterium]|jgi:hypothetical protein